MQPIGTLVLSSSMPPHVLEQRIRQRLGSDIGPVANQLVQTDFDFVGEVVDGTVRVRRRHVYMNSFSPVFRGVIDPMGDGSRLTGEWVLDRGVIGVLYGFRVVAGLFVAAGILAAPFAPIAWVSLGLGLVGAIVFALTFLAPRAVSRGDQADIERMLRDSVREE